MADYRAKNRNNKAGDLARVRAAAKFSTPAPKTATIGSAAATGMPMRGGAGAAGIAGVAALVASALLPKLIGPSVEESKYGLSIAGMLAAPAAASNIGGFLADRIGRPSIMGTPRNDSTPQVFTRTPAMNQGQASVTSTPATSENQSGVLSYPTTSPDVSRLITLMRGEDAIAAVNSGGEARYPDRAPGQVGKKVVNRFVNQTNSRNKKRYQEATRGTPAEGTAFPDELRVSAETALRLLSEQVNDPRNQEFLQKNLKDINASVAGHGNSGVLGKVTGVYGQEANQLEASARQAYGRAGKNIQTWDEVFEYAKTKEMYKDKTIEEIAKLTGAAHKLGQKL